MGNFAVLAKFRCTLRRQKIDLSDGKFSADFNEPSLFNG